MCIVFEKSAPPPKIDRGRTVNRACHQVTNGDRGIVPLHLSTAATNSDDEDELKSVFELLFLFPSWKVGISPPTISSRSYPSKDSRHI
jgi:hypothetical protein